AGVRRGVRLGGRRALGRAAVLLGTGGQGGLRSEHTRGLASPGVWIPPRYQAAFRAGTAFAAISVPSWLSFVWISDVTVANSSARPRSLSTNWLVSSVCLLSSSVAVVAANVASTRPR